MSNTRRFQFIYARIDPSDNMCIEVVDTTNDYSMNPDYIPLTEYNEEYLFKYYNWDNGKFYYDPEYTQEFIP